ncbi:MAG: helix-turn-helix domain-containing GNAT family N-acetyltransferase [Hyphomonadaceae bacterium]|nr:helix-turn-helix domain-containing GNAT family N-acetyltransferase [Hyphomonadaceae bacterium]
MIDAARMTAAPAARIAAVRRFNRFYTREVGLLRKTFLDTPWSLGEMRVLYEIGHGDAPIATDIGKALDLDAAYLSRLLRTFEKDGLITRTRSKSDARQSHLRLTAKGKAAFGAADKRQAGNTSEMLGRLKPEDQVRLVEAMGAIATLLGEPDAETPNRSYVLRDPKPGDYGWIVTRNAEIYSEEYGWAGPFEGVCAQIVADFVNNFDPKLERCWIADMDGERVGCVMLVKDDPKAKKADVARIRLLLLDPKARGMGLGARLVDECIRFSKAKGYKRLTLWTHKELTAARAVYAKAGFTKTSEETHDDWGKQATSEFWDLKL